MVPGNVGNNVGQRSGNKYTKKRRVWQQIREELLTENKQ